MKPSNPTRRDPLDVVVLAYDRLCTFEFGIVVELFGLPRPEFTPWYRLRVARVDEGPLRATGGISIDAPYSLRVLDTAGTIIVPGWRGTEAPVPRLLLRKLRRAHADGARILSVCSGAFVLGEAGLLDGKRATTHWRYAATFSHRFPSVHLDADVLYVVEDNLITSAGSAAGIDMGLHIIRHDFGSTVANAVARRLVVPPHRDGGQKQFIDRPIAPDPSKRALAETLDSLRANLPEQHTIESMARHARMSKRTFARRFAEVTGTTPHRWLQNARVRLVQELLETTSLPLDGIAQRAGFADAQVLRLHFKRVVGISPSAYRRTFH
jgi:AraC family transcriptional activator FtrA